MNPSRDDDPATRPHSGLVRLPSVLACGALHLRCRCANGPCEKCFGADPDERVGTAISGLPGSDRFAHNEPCVRAALLRARDEGSGALAVMPHRLRLWRSVAAACTGTEVA